MCQSHIVWEKSRTNLGTHPGYCLLQLRLAYSDQRDEILFLQTQIRAKDTKIFQLEKDLEYLREKWQRYVQELCSIFLTCCTRAQSPFLHILDEQNRRLDQQEVAFVVDFYLIYSRLLIIKSCFLKKITNNLSVFHRCSR